MKVVAAYLLAVLGGNTSPSTDDIKSILGSGFPIQITDLGVLSVLTVGADGDDDKIEFLLSQLEGKDITEVIASGREKFASVPSGGGVAVAVSGGGGGGGAPAAAAAAPEAKKEEKVEEKEESDEDMGFSLFD